MPIARTWNQSCRDSCNKHTGKAHLPFLQTAFDDGALLVGSIILLREKERRDTLWPPSSLAGEGNRESAKERMGEGSRCPSPFRVRCDLVAALSREGRGH